MSIVKMLRIESTSSEQTEQLGERLGQNLHGGECIELASDLGGGKTTLVHGLAKGIGSSDRVSSPTFTISKIYDGKQLTIHHFDFYRLQKAGLIEYELQDAMVDPKLVVIVEWADVVKNALPSTRLSLEISKTSETSREINFRCPQELEYLLEGIC